MKFIIFITISLLLISLISAETTFFDNPDDFFIMSSSSTGGIIITEEQQASGGGCSYKWNCTNWGECLPSGKQIRICTNIGTCSDAYKTPPTEQNCTYTPPEIEKLSVKNITLFCLTIIFLIFFVVILLRENYFKKFKHKNSKRLR